MARRLNTVLEHVKPSGRDTEDHEHLKQHLLIQSLAAQMHLSKDRLKEMALYMLHEMHHGLEPNNSSTLRMLPSFVYKADPDRSAGVVYALDLGGSNFRVIRMELAKGTVLSRRAHKAKIPETIIAGGTQTQLFDFIADTILIATKKFGRAEEAREALRLGFTFSFPTQQHAINSGSLIRWTKQFKVSGTEGNDVVRLLSDAFSRKKIGFRIVALCNDTVGTLIARFLNDSTAMSGVILGTGSNACYWEKNSRILKCREAQSKPGDGEMVINMEFGNFDSAKMVVLPATKYDNELDAESENAGAQRLEKMISGKYLGEIARRVIVDFAKLNVLPNALADRLKAPYSFESRFVGTCFADRHPGLPDTHDVFKREYDIDIAHEGHRRILRTICRLVSNRAAQLAGMAIAAVLLKRNAQADATVAVDGSVFEKQPYFRKCMREAISAVLGDAEGVRLVLTTDGSGIGAGCIAALQE